MNWESEEDMAKDVEENEELYQAFADGRAPKDEWRQAEKKPVQIEFRGPYYTEDEIETIEGDFEIDEEYLDEHNGYVVIKGVQGEIYPCALDVFEETYRQG